MQEVAFVPILPFNMYQKPHPVSLKPEDVPIEVVSSFEYLGSVVSGNCSTDSDIGSMILKALLAFYSLSHILW